MRPLAALAAVAAAACATAPVSSDKVHTHDADFVVDVVGEPGALDTVEIERWVLRSEAVVAGYLGEFPVPDLRITVVLEPGGRVYFGQHQDGRFLKVFVGRDTPPAVLDDDWVMVHEMFHAAMPDLALRHRWMQEGLSTYLEPVARAQACRIDAKQVWSTWLAMMPKGRPGALDHGLDRSPGWARTYWGGALYWLLVDVDIRAASDNRESVRDAVRGLLDAGGNGRASWAASRVVAVADDATGGYALRALYSRLADAPGDVDTDALFRRLGVVADGDDVRFDDAAPLARVRKAMTAGARPCARDDAAAR